MIFQALAKTVKNLLIPHGSPPWLASMLSCMQNIKAHVHDLLSTHKQLGTLAILGTNTFGETANAAFQ